MNTKAVLIRWSLVLIVTMVGAFLARDVDLREDALDLLPSGAVEQDFTLLARLGLVNRIFISIDKAAMGEKQKQKLPDKELLSSAESVGKAFSASPFFKQVFYRLPEETNRFLYDQLWHHLPAFLGPADLREIEGLLAGDGLNKALIDNFVLLNSVPGIALKEQIRRDPLGFFNLVMKRLENLRGEIAVEVRDGYFLSKNGNSCLLWAESTVSLTDSQTAEKVQQEIDRILDENLTPGIEARIIGSLPHTLANARTVRSDLQRLLPLALAGLVILFLVAFRDLRALLVVMVPFLAAPAALGVVMLFHDTVSAIALGFGIVLLGISVDFAIHLFMGLSRGEDSRDNLLRKLQRPILLATASTLSVFMVLLFSQVPSHRQMALLAIAGISLASAFAWFLIPTLVKNKNRSNNSAHILLSRLSFSSPLRNFVAIPLWLLLVVSGLFAWPQLRYNGDLKTFDVSDPHIASQEKKFYESWGRKGEQSFIFSTGKSLSEALEKNDYINEALQARISGYQTIAFLLPSPVTQLRNIANWKAFWKMRHTSFMHDFQNGAIELGFSSIAFKPFFDWLAFEPEPISPENFVNSPLAPIFATLLRVPEHDVTGEPTKDEDLYLVATVVPESQVSEEILSAIEEKIPGVKVLSNASWRERVENLLRKDIIRLSGAAALLVFCMIICFFRSGRVVLAVLAPVLSALSAMAVFDLLTTRDLNLMHVLMGIMVIGLSVDYGIFMVCAMQEGISKTTVLAVSTCAASTLVGFGVLAFAVHPVLQSLGVTVLAGIGAAWPTALLVTPVLLGNPERAGE